MLCCIASRAPSLLEKASYLGLSAVINVGYVVVFGPVLIAVLTAWQRLRSAELLKQRTAIVASGREPTTERPHAPMLAFFLVPALAVLFLLVQFVQEFAPADSACASDHTRLLWDMGLFSLRGLKPIYCFGVSPEQQKLMPYIFPPIQSWLYLLVGLYTAYLAFRMWREWARARP